MTRNSRPRSCTESPTGTTSTTPARESICGTTPSPAASTTPVSATPCTPAERSRDRRDRLPAPNAATPGGQLSASTSDLALTLDDLLGSRIGTLIRAGETSRQAAFSDLHDALQTLTSDEIRQPTSAVARRRLGQLPQTAP